VEVNIISYEWSYEAYMQQLCTDGVANETQLKGVLSENGGKSGKSMTLPLEDAIIAASCKNLQQRKNVEYINIRRMNGWRWYDG
jgi:hypothetical protein